MSRYITFPLPPALLHMRAHPEKGDDLELENNFWRIAKVTAGEIVVRCGLWPFHKSRVVRIADLYPIPAALDQLGLAPGGATTLWRLRTEYLAWFLPRRT